MHRRQTKILAGVAAVVVIALVAGVAVWLATRDTEASAPPPPPSHAAYQQLYLNAEIGKTRIGVLNQWPKPPYQTFHSGLNQCYEWFDKPVALYTLCFKKGSLVDKAIG